MLRRTLDDRIGHAATLLSDHLALSKLPPHAHTAAYSLAGCFLVQFIISPWLSSRLVPPYARLKRSTRSDWNIRLVAFLHAFYAAVAAAVLLSDETVRNQLEMDKSFAYNSKAGSILAVSLGYFMWDTIVSTIHVRRQGPGFLVHAVLCFSVFLVGFRPFLQYFGICFLLWEVSSIFLGIHWVCDKLNMTGSKVQLVNGIILLSTFFYFRIIYGFQISREFFQEIRRPSVVAALPEGVPFLFQGALAGLTILNIYWFKNMLSAIKKRFDGSSSPINVNRKSS